MTNQKDEVIDLDRETITEDGEIVDAEVVASTDVVVIDSYTPPKVLGGLPHLQEYMMLADSISRTAMVPDNLRNKPDEVLAVVMYGAELGIGPMQALQQINFIKGKPSAAAELLRALVLEAGHKFIINATRTVATARCKRKDWDEYEETTFTIEDAQLAGVVTAGGGWTKYPDQMLSARVTSKACRMWFADVISGMSYVPEEIENFSEKSKQQSNPNGRGRQRPAKQQGATRSAPAVEGVVTLVSESVKKDIETMYLSLSAEEKSEARRLWGEAGVPSNSAEWTSEHAKPIIKIMMQIAGVETPNSESEETAHEEPQSDENRELDASEHESMKSADEISAPKMSKAQYGKLRGLIRDVKGYEEIEDCDRTASVILGYGTTLDRMTKAEASKCIEQLIEDQNS